jgi:hypothetical protein
MGWSWTDAASADLREREPEPLDCASDEPVSWMVVFTIYADCWESIETYGFNECGEVVYYSKEWETWCEPEEPTPPDKPGQPVNEMLL